MWKELRVPWDIVLGVGWVVGVNPPQFRSLLFLVSISICDLNFKFDLYQIPV